MKDGLGKDRRLAFATFVDKDGSVGWLDFVNLCHNQGCGVSVPAVQRSGANHGPLYTFEIRKKDYAPVAFAGDVDDPYGAGWPAAVDYVLDIVSSSPTIPPLTLDEYIDKTEIFEL